MSAAHFILGHCYSALGNQLKAIEEFNKTLETTPLFVEAHLGLGKSYMVMKKYDHAITAFNQALELNPNFYEALTGIGQAQIQEGH